MHPTATATIPNNTSQQPLQKRLLRKWASAVLPGRRHRIRIRNITFRTDQFHAPRTGRSIVAATMRRDDHVMFTWVWGGNLDRAGVTGIIIVSGRCRCTTDRVRGLRRTRRMMVLLLVRVLRRIRTLGHCLGIWVRRCHNLVSAMGMGWSMWAWSWFRAGIDGSISEGPTTGWSSRRPSRANVAVIPALVGIESLAPLWCIWNDIGCANVWFGPVMGRKRSGGWRRLRISSFCGHERVRIASFVCFGLGYPFWYPFLSLDVPLVGFGRVIVFGHGEDDGGGRKRGVG